MKRLDNGKGNSPSSWGWKEYVRGTSLYARLIKAALGLY